MAELNGKQCCALDLPCCWYPPPGVAADAQAVTVAKIFQSHATGLSDEDALAVSRGLLENFDLVPKGVGKAIVDGYRPWLTKATPPETKDQAK